MADAKIDEAARDYLTGSRGEVPPPMDNGIIAGLLWEWDNKLKNTPEGEALGAAIARRLTDPDPTLRARALWFLSVVAPFAATKAVLPLARGDRSLFRNVFADGDSKTDLEWKLLYIVGKLVVGGDGEAREVARAEALNPTGRPGMLSGRWRVSMAIGCESIELRNGAPASGREGTNRK